MKANLLKLAIALSILAACSPQLKTFLDVPRSDAASPRTSDPQTASSSPNLSGTEAWTVSKVSDGDTIRVKNPVTHQSVNIRFCGIDAPEIQHGKKPGQPFGKEAQDKLKSLLQQAGNQVLIREIERDRYGRVVGEIYTKQGNKSTFINAELVRSGLAYHYARYSSNCKDKALIVAAENEARNQRLNVWSGNYQAPWDYRKMVK